mmetsp:Transcript_27472/g.68972  ORF Transcript_27472/g.68972 Transcript_27472/m.68972 type:complete len:108 (+) Transcript_27472:304-627(+)
MPRVTVIPANRVGDVLGRPWGHIPVGSDCPGWLMASLAVMLLQLPLPRLNDGITCGLPNTPAALMQHLIRVCIARSRPSLVSVWWPRHIIVMRRTMSLAFQMHETYS